MPVLNTQLMLTIARDRFSSFQLRLPPAGGARAAQLQILSAGGTALRSISARSPALFLAASTDTRDIELQRACNTAMDSYLSRICDAIGHAHNAWRMQARLVQVMINATAASGGSLQGPGLGPQIQARAPRDSTWQRTRSEAIATGIALCWQNWQWSVSIPGLPWYPAFAAFPGPVAPPTPNVPAPLVVLLQNPVALNSGQLKAHMLAHYSGDNEWPNELFESVSAGMERAFQVWAQSQMITNVIGTGPVPTFAPPYVPVGPVVGGTGTQTPGAWAD